MSNNLKTFGVGRNMLFCILKANHMLIEPKRSCHITANSHYRFKKHKNLIEEITPSEPEQIWLSDITYIDIEKIRCI